MNHSVCAVVACRDAAAVARDGRRVAVLVFCLAAASTAFGAGLQPEPSATGAAAVGEPAATAPTNPIPYGEDSIERGKLLYRFHGCAECHGRDGKALIEVVADATDLTDPDVWRNGTDEAGVFLSLRDGAGLGMPPFAGEVDDEADLWHLVNFIFSLWPESRRPSAQAGSP